MKGTVAFLLLPLVFGSSWSLHLVDFLHQLPADREPYYCILNSGTQRHMIQEAFRDISRNGQQQIIVASKDVLIPSEKITHFLITFDDDSWEHTEHQFLQLFRLRCWNNLGYFVFLSGTDYNLFTLSKYAELMKLLGITKSVLLFSNFHPLSYDYFAQKVWRFIDVNQVINYLQKDHVLDVQGYVFRISVLQFFIYILITHDPLSVTGITAQFLEAFADHLNATIDWLVEVWDPAETSNNILQNNIDIVINVPLISVLMDYVYENQYLATVFLVPERMRESFFKQMLVPFTLTVWIFLVIFVIICVLLNKVLKRILPHNMILMVFFGSANAEHDLPRIERFVFLALTILMFLLSEAYLAKMFSYILNEQYEPHLMSLEEFERTTIPVCTDFKVDQIYRENVRRISPNLEKRMVRQNGSMEWYDMESCSWLVNHQMAEEFLNYKNNHDPITMRKKLYMLPQILGWQPMVHSISRRGPFLKRFELTYQSIFESGLFQHWKEHTSQIFVQRQWSSISVLGWDDLLSLWNILGYGFALSTVVFFAEIGVKFTKKFKQIVFDIKKN